MNRGEKFDHLGGKEKLVAIAVLQRERLFVSQAETP